MVNFIDITEIKRIDSILAAVLDSTPSPINAKRAIRNAQNEIIDFEYIAANKALEDELRIEPGSIIGKTLRTLALDRENKETFNYFKEVVETGIPKHFEHYDQVQDK